MTTEHKMTAEEEAYYDLLDEKRDEVTEAARGLFGIAQNCAYAYNLCRNYSFQAEEFYMADHNMLYLARALTARDREVLAEVAQAAKTASDSLDKDDRETPAGFRICVANLHYYYALISEMVGKALKPTDRWEIDSAQFELWRAYGEWYEEWCAQAKAEAEALSAKRRSDESPEDLPF